MARRSTRSAVQSARSQSSASDGEGDESQRVLALSSLLQTPKTNHRELQEFKTEVATDQQELKTFLAQRMRQAEDASRRRRNELTEAVLQALQTPNRPVQGTPPLLGGTKIARNAAFKSVASVLTASEHLVSDYDRLNRILVGLRDAEPEGIAETWTEEIGKTARLLKIGAATAIKNVKKVLGAEVEVNDTEEIDGETMEPLENMELSYELYKSLQCADGGVRKMVKSLPQDEER